MDTLSIFRSFLAAVNVTRRAVQRTRRMLALIAPSLTIVWFTLANWLGSSRLAKIFRSRGYLLGTSQVLLENAQRGSAPPEGSDSTSEVPRVPGLPPNTALVPIPGDKIVGIYTQASAFGSFTDDKSTRDDGCWSQPEQHPCDGKTLAARMFGHEGSCCAEGHGARHRFDWNIDGDHHRCRARGKPAQTTAARCRRRPASSTSCRRPLTRRREPRSQMHRSSRRRRC